LCALDICNVQCNTKQFLYTYNKKKYHLAIRYPTHFISDSEWSLLLIKQRAHVGKIDQHNIYKIYKIAVIPLSSQEPVDLDLEVYFYNN
jgi:hypothetical protein